VLLVVVVLLFFISCWVFLLNGADILVSMGHVIENARLVDVDGGPRKECGQAESFVVVHGRSFSHSGG